jgi:hypothetical protein
VIYILICIAGTDLTRIGEMARKKPDLVFASLYHRVTDLYLLRAEVQRRGQKPKQFAFLGFKHYCGKNLT